MNVPQSADRLHVALFLSVKINLDQTIQIRKLFSHSLMVKYTKKKHQKQL